MKIKLSANSVVSLPEKFSDINLEHGYSFGVSEDVLKTSWFKKLQSKIISGVDKTFSLVKPLDEESQKVVEYTTNAAKFLNEQEETNKEHIDGLNIQLNLNSSFNKFLKVCSFNAHKILGDKTPKSILNLNSSLDSNAGHIYSLDKKMYIGSDIFKEKDFFTSTNYVKNELGLEKATNFLIFHEASHSFEHTNLGNFGFQSSPTISRLRTLTCILNNNDHYISSINDEISKHPEWGTSKIDPFFISNTFSLFREIYADVGSILLQRNKDIIDGVHSKTDDIKNVNTIINGRNQEQLEFKKNFSSNLYVGNYNHFTSPGLSHIKNLLTDDHIPNKVLTQEEIHNIAIQSIEVGISRVLLANIQTNNDNVGQLKTLFNMEFNPNSEKFKYSINGIKPESYAKGIKDLEYFAGGMWLGTFNHKLELLEKHKVSDPRGPWHAAFHNEQFHMDLFESAIKNKELEELFGSNTTKIETSISIKPMSSILNSMSAIRENAEKKNSSQHQLKI